MRTGTLFAERACLGVPLALPRPADTPPRASGHCPADSSVLCGGAGVPQGPSRAGAAPGLRPGLSPRRLLRLTVRKRYKA